MCSDLSRVSAEHIMVNASTFCRKTETKTVMTYLKRPVYFHPGNEHAMRDLASLQPVNGHLESISSFQARSNTAVFHPGCEKSFTFLVQQRAVSTENCHFSVQAVFLLI
jgi:hypothetical protein